MKRLDKIHPSNSPSSPREVSADYNSMTDKQLRSTLKELLHQQPPQKPAVDTPSIIEELHLHQAELEMQNRELRSVQSVLESSRERYAELYDYAPVGYISLDINGQILELNLTASTILNRERALLIGQPFSACLIQGQSSDFFTFLHQIKEHGNSTHFKTRINHPGGEHREVQLVGNVRPDPVSGEPIWQIAIHDITDEERRQEELRLHSIIMDNMLEGVMLSSQKTGRIIETNPAFDQMFGYSRGELEGLTIDRLMANNKNQLVKVFHQLTSNVEHSGYWEGEVENRRKDGSTFWSDSSIINFEHKQYGKVLLTVQRDITARKLAEHDAQVRQDALVHMARINTVGELAASLAHELTQPLQAIEHFNHSALQLLQVNQHDGQDDVLSLLHSAEQQIQRAAKIIFHLRKFIRQGKVNKRPSNIYDVVMAALELIQPMLRDKSIDIKLESPSQLPLVNIEPIQIEQVLVNLLRNSIDAISSANCKLRQIQICLNHNESQVQVNISDSGPGLSPQRAEHVFDIMGSDKPDGMGMGLAISRSLIKAHGGRLWASTDTHSGATFNFTLPLADPDAHPNG